MLDDDTNARMRKESQSFVRVAQIWLNDRHAHHSGKQAQGMGALQDRGHQAHNLKAADSNPARERTLPRPSSLTAMATVDAKRTAGVDVERPLRMGRRS